jgi:hypothetical protein
MNLHRRGALKLDPSRESSPILVGIDAVRLGLLARRPFTEH